MDFRRVLADSSVEVLNSLLGGIGGGRSGVVGAVNVLPPCMMGEERGSGEECWGMCCVGILTTEGEEGASVISVSICG